MNKGASVFGNPWPDGDGSYGGFASSPEFANPWADESGNSDATVSGTDETAATTRSDFADSLEQQRDRLLAAFGNLDPCSATDFGTPEGTHWEGSPEMGLGCSDMKEGKTTLVVPVASGAPIPLLVIRTPLAP